ncbi:MAG: hypothetical protein ACLQIB_37825 [Isosphaeraceae bacterium]
MGKPALISVYRPLLLTALFALPIGGCGDGLGTSPPPVEPFDSAKLAAALPSGITLQTPVRPDKRYGESAKTVEDALKGLFAILKDNTICDGFGHEVRFVSRAKASAKPAGKSGEVQTVVYLAN